MGIGLLIVRRVRRVEEYDGRVEEYEGRVEEYEGRVEEPTGGVTLVPGFPVYGLTFPLVLQLL